MVRNLSIYVLVLSLSSYSLGQMANFSSLDKEIKDAQKVEELIQEMTLEEKIGQMTQITLDVITQDHYASITPDNKRLRRFKKIELQPKEIQTITFQLTPKDLSFVNADNVWVTEKGTFSIFISQLEEKFTIKDNIL